VYIDSLVEHKVLILW